LPDISVRPLFLRQLLFAVALAAALLAGGGGAEGPLSNGLIAAIGLCLLLLIAADHFAGLRPLPKSALISALLAIALLLIPFLQLVPLPPELWQALPGRELAISALREAGAAQGWRPLSLDPEATKRSAAMLALPVALFLHTARSSREDNLVLLKVAVACAGISGVVGALQLSGGYPDWLIFYDGPSSGAASGIFANPNHQSLLMVCAMAASAILVRVSKARRRQSEASALARQLIPWSLLLFFAVMALASGSRAGFLLLSLALPGALLVALGSGSLLRWAATVVGVLAVLWVIILLYPSTNSLAVRESFRIGADARYAYLPDILYTLGQYWPAGSGLGTFADVFAPNENLDFAQQGYLNHAHNDFLEWLIETGAAGAVWLGLAVIVMLHVGYKVFRDKNHDHGTAAGGALVILLVAVHSLADYSLRTAAISAFTAVALGLLPSALPRPAPIAATPRKLVPLFLAMLIALPVAAEGLRLFIVQWAVRDGKQGVALRLAPSDGRVLVQQAAAQLRAGNSRKAEQLASLAVNATPLDGAALRTLAISREGQGKMAGSTWRVASSLGWRDAPTQVWAFRQALVDGEHEIAALRADALLRTSNPPVEFIRLVRLAAREPRFAVSLTHRLQLNPQWRRKYFLLTGGASRDEIAGLIATMGEMAKTEDTLLRADGQSLIAHSINQKAYDDAMLVDRLVAGNRPTSGNLIDDGGFSRTANEYVSNSTSFDWLLRKGPHTSGSIEIASPSYLVADSDGERSQPAAERYVRLPAGTYRLSYRVRADAADAFRIRIACVDRSAPLASDLAPGSQSFSQRTLTFAVDAACPLTRLIVESMPSGAAATADFDEFEVVPA
jgi:hypothetical protein